VNPYPPAHPHFAQRLLDLSTFEPYFGLAETLGPSGNNAAPSLVSVGVVPRPGESEHELMVTRDRDHLTVMAETCAGQLRDGIPIIREYSAVIDGNHSLLGSCGGGQRREEGDCGAIVDV